MVGPGFTRVLTLAERHWTAVEMDPGPRPPTAKTSTVVLGGRDLRVLRSSIGLAWIRFHLGGLARIVADRVGGDGVRPSSKADASENWGEVVS